MVQFCCIKGQPLAINIENAAKKVFAGENLVNCIGNIFGNALFRYVCSIEGSIKEFGVSNQMFSDI